MARPGYLSIYADERTQKIFDEFTKEKGVSKSTVLSEMMQTYMLAQDEELYLKIEETILAIPEVKGFTSEGLQNIVKGITSAFGKKAHKGILIRHDKNGMTINIFISLIYGCHVHEVGYLVQKQVQREILLLTDEPVLSVDVAVTEVIK